MKVWFISVYTVHVGTSKSTQAGWIRANKSCDGRTEVTGSKNIFSLWVKTNREGKISEVSVAFLKTWHNSSSWLNTEIHPAELLPPKTFLRCLITNKSLARRLEFLERLYRAGDKSASCTRLRSGLVPLDWWHSLLLTLRDARGDGWGGVFCPSAQVIANLRLAVRQSCACYRP